MYWLLIGMGILSCYIFDADYNFNTGECGSGWFCSRDNIKNEAACSFDDNSKLYGGCALVGFMGMLISLVIIIVIVALIILLYFFCFVMYWCCQNCMDIKSDYDEKKKQNKDIENNL